MMNFQDFANKVNADKRLCALVERYEQNTESLSDAEMAELCDRYDRAYGGMFGELYTEEDLLDDDAYADLLMPDDEDDIWQESRVDLFGVWWE